MNNGSENLTPETENALLAAVASLQPDMTVEEVKGVADGQASLAYKDEVLYMGDHTMGKEKVYVYKDGKLTGFEQPKGAQAPYSIALF